MNTLSLAEHGAVIPVIVIHRLEDAVPLARALVEGGVKVLEGTLRTPIALQCMRAIASEVPEAILGAVATTGLSPYTHTYTMAATLPSLTLEGRRGNSGNSEIFEGCKVKSATLACAVGEVATLDAEFMAQTSTARAASGSPAYGTGELVAFHQAPTITFNAVSYAVKNYSLEFDNGLERVDELGTLSTAEPGFASLRTVKLKATLAYRADTLYVANLTICRDLQIERT